MNCLCSTCKLTNSGRFVGHTEVIAANGALSRIISAFQDGDVRELEPGRSALWNSELGRPSAAEPGVVAESPDI